MRDTEYAREIARGTYPWSPDSEARIERLHIKEHDQEEIRFSWWKQGNIVMRPLDLTEEELLVLFQNSVEEGVFSSDFLRRLRQILGN
jgi:hypothetical protein